MQHFFFFFGDSYRKVCGAKITFYFFITLMWNFVNDEEKIISLYESDKKIIHNLPYYQGQSHVHWWGL